MTTVPSSREDQQYLDVPSAGAPCMGVAGGQGIQDVDCHA